MQTPNLATRRWWYIMPIVFITYSLAYLDRANYVSTAASVARCAVDNLLAALAGERPVNLVNAGAWVG